MAELIPELARPVRLDTIGEVPRAIRIDASADERAALARRFGIVAIGRLAADAMLVRIGEAVQCEGRLVARVVQACVASGEDVPQEIDEPFALCFVPETDGPDTADEEVELDEAALDEVSYRGGAVDVGEAVAQTLALALDPYPRAPDADEALQSAGVTDGSELGPFAGLKGLLGEG